MRSLSESSSYANVTERRTDWNSVNWRKANRIVRNLRQRIFRASTEGNLKKVRSLQKLMLGSYSNTLVSVRRVTQVNKGKNTPGVDKMLVKTPIARSRLVEELTRYTPWKAEPVRRIYIPKANGEKQRPLGIPTIRNRCLQAMVKNALEPYWEARFEGTSYGFRPGRSTHDAIARVYTIARPHCKKKWIVDADIKGAFDNIDHEFLLKIMGSFPGKELIKQWLKAGYMEQGRIHKTETGVPQGGVVSPLLFNIALHGAESILGIRYDNWGRNQSKRAIVRYADDMVAFCESKEDAEEVTQILKNWLKERGLELSPEKTKIRHLSDGFDFLGFNIRQYKSQYAQTGWKLLIKPSKESVQRLRDKLRKTWHSLKGQNVSAIVGRLNPVIRGWANYYRIAVAWETFSKLDNWMFRREVRYVNHTHPKKPKYWKKARYWRRLPPNRQDSWVFGDKQKGLYLLKFSWFSIERHVLVKGRASPDDPNLREYWQKRNTTKANDLMPSRKRMAREQGGICPVCGEPLFNDEEIQVHHKKPIKEGGTDNYGNLQLLHLYCHQQVHSMRMEICA
jgi:RNA-directed DNA polymerase